MATIHQLTANIANAQASTGPRTGAGKQSAASNAIRHGLFTCFDRLHPEDQILVQTAYEHFRALYPQPEAGIWVRELAFAWFRRDRARALCVPLYAREDEEAIKALDRFHRWDRQFTRDIDKTLKLLNSLPKPESGPDPEPAPAAPKPQFPLPMRLQTQIQAVQRPHRPPERSGNH